jgi:hypothetical protein
LNSRYNNIISDKKRFLNDNKNLNNFMTNRLISPITILSNNRNSLNYKNNYKNKAGNDMPLSPYIKNKYNIKGKMNKNNSTSNIFNFSKQNNNINKYPNIYSHNFLKNSSSNDLNQNFNKTSTAFNHHQKDNILVPINSNYRNDSIGSANNLQKMNSKENSFPLPMDIYNKNYLDLNGFHISKNGHAKGYGKHYGNEKDCPVCQSILMKNNYIMKQMNNYKDLDKYLDNEQIKNNKEQFLQDLKKPYSKLQQEEENIIRQIRYFLNSSKKSNYSNDNNKRSDDDGNLINAYFGK